MTEGVLVQEYSRVHSQKRYGDTGWRSLPFILPHILALQPTSLIDFGCGQSDLAFRLARHSGVATVGRFDPAIPILATPPKEFFDVLVNVDVLEHIPDEEIDAAVAHMAALARDAVIVIDTAPARLILSDGRNAHVSQHDEAWWLARLKKSYPTIRPIEIGRKSRVGFKTFDAALPTSEHLAIERSAVRSRNFERALRILRLWPRF